MDRNRTDRWTPGEGPMHRFSRRRKRDEPIQQNVHAGLDRGREARAAGADLDLMTCGDAKPDRHSPAVPTSGPHIEQAATWTVERTRHIWRDGWISLRADDCVTASGAAVAPFYVLEYPDWVHVVALDRFDRVLLVRQYRQGFGDMFLE